MAPSFELLRGTLDLLILKALTTGPYHGLGISRRIEQLTGGTFQVKPGSLFPALHRLEERGWLKAEWGVSETNRRARYYELTAMGKKQFAAEVSSWNRIAAAINLSLAST